jgi:hypothetical protein
MGEQHFYDSIPVPEGYERLAWAETVVGQQVIHKI